ncbi:MAG: enoyl-CoA hydratase/isomerase family protein [Chitinophagaceae bacterium]|nr:MAG: enoyl-CoA hydratase/isomerase family protein [Chitinophagaceae bacterium]
MNYETIEIELNQAVATIWLNRVDVYNAINQQMILELIKAVIDLNKDETVRVIVFRGRGKHFCTGADLNWMKNAANFTNEENLKESKTLAMCFHSIYHCSKPTIALVQGAVMGGGNGLMAACDFVYAMDDAYFALSEVKLGLIPATISPFIIKRIGEFNAKDLMLTARKIDVVTASEMRLINRYGTSAEIEEQLKSTIHYLLAAGPNAINACKNLIYDVMNILKHNELTDYTASAIASIRKTEEAQEGMEAFLEKRKPYWNQ